MKIELLLAFMVLAGCAGGWSRPGTSEAEFRRDSYECERDQRMVSASFQTPRPNVGPPANMAMGLGEGLGNLSNSSNEIAFFFRCMESKGYYWKNDNAPSRSPVIAQPEIEFNNLIVPPGVTYAEFTATDERCSPLADPMPCFVQAGYKFGNPPTLPWRNLETWKKNNFPNEPSVWTPK